MDGRSTVGWWARTRGPERIVVCFAGGLHDKSSACVHVYHPPLAIVPLSSLYPSLFLYQ